MPSTIQGAPSQGHAAFAQAMIRDGASVRPGPAWSAAMRAAQDRPGAPAAPTSLLSERLGDGASNCLEAATKAAGPGDELVFLHDNRTRADGNNNNAGHVLVRDRATGEVRDPSAPGGKAYADLGAWMAGHTAEGGRPAYSFDGAASSGLVKDVLSRPPEERQARIDALGDPALSSLARRLYDDAPAAPTPDEAGALSTVVANWDALRDGDDKFSRDDLEKIAGDDPPAWANDALKDAAHKLLDDGGFFDRLDTAGKGGETDGKVSDEDLGAATQWAPLTGEGNDALNTLAHNWDAVRGGDDKFSRDDLEQIAGDDPPAWANDQIKGAAHYLLDHPELMMRLDTQGKGGVPDGKVSSRDLGAAMQSVPLDEPADRAVRTVDANWDAMRQGRDSISRRDLMLMASDDAPAFVTPEIRGAAQYLLAHPATLTFRLDVAGGNGKPDDVFDRADLDALKGRMTPTPIGGSPREQGPDAKAPAFLDYIQWTPHPDQGTIEYQTSEGKFVVSRDTAPDLFKQVESDTEAHDAIRKATADGAIYALPGQAPDVTPDKAEDLGNGVFKFEDGGKSYVVARATNPTLYDKAADAAQADMHANADDVRAKHDLPPAGELTVPGLKTDVPSDPKKPDSEKLTVSGLAITNLLEDYRKGVEDGSIAKDDPRAKLVRALEAKSALESGRAITGYSDELGWRNIDNHQTQLTPEDMQDIIKGDKVDDQLQALFGDETVSKDLEAKTAEAVSHVPDKEGLTRKLEETLLGKDAGDTRYIDYIKDLKDQGKPDAAQADVSAMVQSLTLLDPEKGKAAAQQLQVGSVTADLNDLVGNADKVSDENKTKATKDLFDLLKGAIKSGTLDLPRQTVDTIEKFIEGFLNGNVDQKKAIAAVQGAAKEAAENGGKIPAASLDKYKAFVPLKDQAGLMGFLGGMNDKGVLGSLGGSISLMSGIYQLTAKGGQFADTPRERMSVAKDFLSFIGGSASFIKTGDAIFGALGKGGAVELLGLRKEVPEIWGSTGLWGKKLEEAHKPDPASTHPDTGGSSRNSLDSIIDLYGDDRPALPSGSDKPLPPLPGSDKPLPPLPGADDPATKGAADALNGRLGAAGAPEVDPSVAAKIAGSTVKVLGAASDGVGGVADIVLGALTIKDGLKAGNELTQAAGGLQVAGGAAGALAGGIGIAALFGPLAAGAAAATGPLFLIGAAVGGIGAIVSYFAQHKTEQKATDKEGQWYKDLAGDNLLAGDWGDRVEYARCAIYNYGDRDAPDNGSMFRFQSAEWNHFRFEPQANGGSRNRLDGNLHVDGPGEGNEA